MAGHVALDFVNTAEERGHPDAGDVLRAAADLRRWGERYGLLCAAADASDRGHGDGAARAELRRALEARELLYALLGARAHGRPAGRAELDRLADLVAAAYRAGRLGAAADGRLEWSWSPDELASVRHLAVVAGAQLLGEPTSGRLKQCPGEHCGWFFLDATKRGNRRWCSMSECGQDAKSARRRARSRS